MSRLKTRVLPNKISSFQHNRFPFCVSAQSHILDQKDIALKEPKELICVGFDPGIKNHAVSILHLTFIDGVKVLGKSDKPQNVLKVKIIKSGILSNPMYDINIDVIEQNRKYCNEVQRILDKYQPQVVCAERFQNRGFRAGGVQMEAVNLMLGALATLPQFDTRMLKLVSPMVWKAAIKRKYDLKEQYKLCDYPVHELDAALIGIYGAHILLNKKPFVDIELDMEDLHAQIKLATKSKVREKKRKGKKNG